MKKLFKEALEDSPIIAAVKDDEGLSRCLTSDSRIIFILYGDIVTISDIVETVKSAGKLAIVHLDLINGLSSKEVAVDFLQKYTNADGIITTKPTLIKRAKELGLFTILRLFLIDSMAYENIDRQVKSSRPDLIEILPALMPKVIAKVCQSTSTPVIAGGLVSEKEDILALLDAGATSPQTRKSGFYKHSSPACIMMQCQTFCAGPYAPPAGLQKCRLRLFFIFDSPASCFFFRKCLYKAKKVDDMTYPHNG